MKRLIIYTVLLTLFCHCKDDDEEKETPAITGLTVTEITDTAAQCSFTITLAGEVQKAGVIYDLYYSLPEDAPEVTTTSIAGGNISLTMTGLDNNTYYYYKAYITTKEGKTVNSTVNSFKTELPPLYVSPTTIETPYRAGIFQFDVIAKNAWTITSSQSWCAVQPDSGDGDSEITVSVSVTENLSGVPRNAILTVTDGNLSQEVTVEQSFLTRSNIEPEMVFVAGGAFNMGCTSEQNSDCYNDEIPVHQVTVNDFYLSKYEVTQAQWREVMGYNHSYFTGDSLPVENVSWNEVQEYITQLNTLTGKQYRLPAEAEWEFAARGGNKSMGYMYSGSHTVDAVAWFWNNIPSQTMGVEGYGTQPVGTKSPNELGLFDMSGNVFEWCSDWYGAYDDSTQTNPAGPLSGVYRVVRGGSWNSGHRDAYVSSRGFIIPELRYNYLGFRLASCCLY